MKSVFDVILIIFITIVMFMSMVFFTDEVVVSQEAVHIRNEVINLIEIYSGYTEEAKAVMNSKLESLDKDVTITVSKEGKLIYGEEVKVEVSILYNRKLPFLNIDKEVIYKSKGVFYNVSS